MVVSLSINEIQRGLAGAFEPVIIECCRPCIVWPFSPWAWSGLWAALQQVAALAHAQHSHMNALQVRRTQMQVLERAEKRH